MLPKVEARSTMPNVAVSTVFVTSQEWLLQTSPQVKGWWVALLGHCTREENGGRIAGADRWDTNQWLFALGKGGSRDAAEAVVREGLAEWDGDDLVVVGYSVEWERGYQQSRKAGRKGAQLKKQKKLDRLAGGDGPDGAHGESPPSSPPSSPPPSPPSREPGWLGRGGEGNVGEGNVSDGIALSEDPSPARPTRADQAQIDPTPAEGGDIHRAESKRDPDGPDPVAQLANCLRAHAGTTASDSEKRALLSYCDSLPREKVQPALCRLWDYWKACWKADKSPTVTAWLDREQRGRR